MRPACEIRQRRNRLRPTAHRSNQPRPSVPEDKKPDPAQPPAKPPASPPKRKSLAKTLHFKHSVLVLRNGRVHPTSPTSSEMMNHHRSNEPQLKRSTTSEGSSETPSGETPDSSTSRAAWRSFCRIRR
jgi:hypothetical protein